jgi:hypothetical protein
MDALLWLPGSSRPLRRIALGLFVAAVVASPALADPTLGFLETWPGTSTQGWGGGSLSSNPGTGGIDGPADGFLLVSNTSSTNLGSHSSGAAYTGNWRAAKVNQVKLWLDNLATNDPLEIHFAIGTGTNFWQYDQGFVPPVDMWAEFSVDLSTQAGFTQIIDAPGGTFEEALTAVETILLRHDLAPYAQSPDPAAGDFGVDDLLLTNTLVGVEPPPSAVARPVLLAPPYPNPTRDAVALSLQTFDGEPVRVEIVDVAGRVLKSALLAGQGPGSRLWTWDGRDGAGRRVPAGSYRARAFSRSGGTSRSLVVLR